jgi:hypothetical protein
MYGGSGRDAAGSVVVFEDLWYFRVPSSLQVQREMTCFQHLPCLVGVSIVLGWASGGITLSALLVLTSPASYRRSLLGTRWLWLIFGFFGTHRCARLARPLRSRAICLVMCGDRFYLKRNWSGLLFLCSFGLLGVGVHARIFLPRFL